MLEMFELLGVGKSFQLTERSGARNPNGSKEGGTLSWLIAEFPDMMELGDKAVSCQTRLHCGLPRMLTHQKTGCYRL